MAPATPCAETQLRLRPGTKNGPFYYLTQCLAAGKVNKFLLRTPAGQDRARAAAAAFNVFYDRMEELSQINAERLRREKSSHKQP